MSKSYYLLRIDDVCETMRHTSFARIRAVCDEYSITPIMGIVPDNKDPKLRTDAPQPDFWEDMKVLAAQGWIIAQHGYQHVYNEDKTEFAGLPYAEQKRKILLGKDILVENLGYAPTWFMAPAHSFDSTTCAVLHELSFTHITDGVALYPFLKNKLIWVPQQLWRPKRMPLGIWTICLHPNTMSSSDIDDLASFVASHASQFKNVPLQPRASIYTLPMSIAWHTIRYMKRI